MSTATVVETLWWLTPPAVYVSHGGEVTAATVVETLWTLPLLLQSVSMEAN